MTTRSRRVLVFRAQLTYTDTTQSIGNVDVPSDLLDVMKLLKDLPWDWTQAENAYMTKGGIVYALRIDGIDEDAGIVKGQFAAIDKEVLPDYELNGVVDSVQLPVDAGIYYPFHFVFYTKKKHFAIEYNRSGPRLEHLQQYLEEKLNGSGLLDSAFFYQIFREDPFEAIEKMGSIAEIEVEVVTNKTEAFLGSDYEGVLTGLSQLAPEKAVLKFGISREKGASSGQAIDKTRFLRWARRRANAQNVGVKVKARVEEQTDDSGASIWMDVFAQKYATKINVRINKNRSVNSQHCYEQIQQVYTRMMSP